MPAFIRRTTSSESGSLSSTAITGVIMASFVILVVVTALAGRLLRKRNADRRTTSARRSLILSRIQRSQQIASTMGNSSPSSVNNDADIQNVGFEFREKEMYAIYDDYVRDHGGLSPTPFSRQNITPNVVLPVKAPTRSTPPSPKGNTFGQTPSANASTSSLVFNGGTVEDMTPSVFFPSVLIRGQPRPLGLDIGSRDMSPPTSPTSPRI